MKTFLFVIAVLAAIQVSVGGMLVHKVEQITAAHQVAMEKTINAAK